MDNYEEYLLKVLKRTNTGLQDSLIPVHAAKLSKFVEKFEKSPSLLKEVDRLKNVTGFAKCATAMRWLLERTKRPEEIFSPEQFESDILMMNEKLFEAFLNQPFDMPDYSLKNPVDAPVRPIQKDVQLAEDEFMLMGSTIPAPESHDVPGTAAPSGAESLEPEESDWKPAFTETFAEALINATDSSHTNEISPALSEVMSPELLETTKNLSKSAEDFSLKAPGERPIAMAVMRVSAKSALETSKSTNNLIIQEFFQALVGLINFADKEGKIRSEDFSAIIRDVADRLMNALNDTSNGVNALKNLTQFIQDPKELFKKR